MVGALNRTKFYEVWFQFEGDNVQRLMADASLDEIREAETEYADGGGWTEHLTAAQTEEAYERYVEEDLRRVGKEIGEEERKRGCEGEAQGSGG